MHAVVLLLLAASAASFSITSSGIARVARMGLTMQNAPGRNLKPMADGTFKEAGAHLETYVLEHENGARALVDTATATCTSWITKDGKQLIKQGAGTAHFINGKPITTHFVPEERAKKVSFDRMIFKCFPENIKGLEYRVDVTMREDTLEYDVTVKNYESDPLRIQMTLTPHITGSARISGMKGFTEKVGDESVATSAWDVPVGKFKETGFYMKVDSA